MGALGDTRHPRANSAAFSHSVPTRAAKTNIEPVFTAPLGAAGTGHTLPVSLPSRLSPLSQAAWPRDPASPVLSSTAHPRPDLTRAAPVPVPMQPAGPHKPRQVPGVARGARGCLGPPCAAPGAGSGPRAGGSGCVKGGSETLSGGEEQPAAPPGPAGGDSWGGPTDGWHGRPLPQRGAPRGQREGPCGDGDAAPAEPGQPEPVSPSPVPLVTLRRTAATHPRRRGDTARAQTARPRTRQRSRERVPHPGRGPQHGGDGLALACPAPRSPPRALGTWGDSPKCPQRCWVAGAGLLLGQPGHTGDSPGTVRTPWGQLGYTGDKRDVLQKQPWGSRDTSRTAETLQGHMPEQGRIQRGHWGHPRDSQDAGRTLGTAGMQ